MECSKLSTEVDGNVTAEWDEDEDEDEDKDEVGSVAVVPVEEVSGIVDISMVLALLLVLFVVETSVSMPLEVVEYWSGVLNVVDDDAAFVVSELASDVDVDVDVDVAKFCAVDIAKPEVCIRVLSLPLPLSVEVAFAVVGVVLTLGVVLSVGVVVAVVSGVEDDDSGASVGTLVVSAVLVLVSVFGTVERVVEAVEAKSKVELEVEVKVELEVEVKVEVEVEVEIDVDVIIAATDECITAMPVVRK